MDKTFQPDARYKRIEWLLLCIGAPEVELDDWEQKFYEDIERQFRTRGRLSDKQLDKLEEVYTRRT